MISLLELGGSLGSGGVLLSGSDELASELVEVGANCVPLFPVAEGCPHPFGLGEAGAGAVDVSDRDGPVEDHGGVVLLGVVAEGGQSSYHARICGQSVSPEVIASA